MKEEEIREIDISLADPHPISDALYPFVAGGVNSFFERYLSSASSILILIGAPGTGKTSFIRNFMWARQMSALVTFDKKVMLNEEYYINFLSAPNHNLMVLEDADELLAAREHDRNFAITKLLNVSDGLIKLTDKKMIFSTNLPDRAHIDAALMRPGRCFDVLHFRALTKAEADLVCVEYDLPFIDGKEAYLSELFNGKSREPIQRRLGFARQVA